MLLQDGQARSSRSPPNLQLSAPASGRGDTSAPTIVTDSSPSASGRDRYHPRCNTAHLRRAHVAITGYIGVRQPQPSQRFKPDSLPVARRLDPFAHRSGRLAKSFIAQFIVLEEGEMFTRLEFQLISGTVLLLRLMAPSLIRQRALSSNPDTDVPGQPGLQAQRKPA